MKKVVLQVYENGRWSREVVFKRKASKYQKGHQAVLVVFQAQRSAMKKAA